MECICALLPDAASLSTTQRGTSREREIPPQKMSAPCVHFTRSAPYRSSSHDEPRPTLAVLVPAHQEEATIARTIRSLRSQLESSDRLVVIADNCSDRTSDVAEAAGAEVVIRQDSDCLGKGYALAHGLEFLSQAPPEVVVVVDADCQIASGSLDVLAREAVRAERPVQGNNLVLPPANTDLRASVNAFAFMVKNFVRPRGLSRLGLPCLLMGTGMALPWKVIRQAPLATDNIVEDMQMGIELSLKGYPPVFCPEASVTSPLPETDRAAREQRRRWEHGHLETLLSQVPRLLWRGLRERRFELLALAMELAVPPLSLVALMWMAATTATAIAAWWGITWWPATMLAAGGLLLSIAVAVAWLRFARSTLPAASLLSAPLYVLWKIPLYVAFMLHRQKVWVSTERDCDHE